MNWVTIAILVIIGGLTYRAYVNGFIRELVSLTAVILAVPIAGVLYDDMVPKVEPIVDNVALASLISFLSILAGIIIGGQVAAHLLRRTAEVMNLGSVDKAAGAAFGFMKGVIICQVLLIALIIFPEPDVRDDIDSSPVATALVDGTPMVLGILPGQFDRAVDLFNQGIDRVEAAAASLGGSNPTGSGSTAR